MSTNRNKKQTPSSEKGANPARGSRQVATPVHWDLRSSGIVLLGPADPQDQGLTASGFVPFSPQRVGGKADGTAAGNDSMYLLRSLAASPQQGAAAGAAGSEAPAPWATKAASTVKGGAWCVLCGLIAIVAILGVGQVVSWLAAHCSHSPLAYGSPACIQLKGFELWLARLYGNAIARVLGFVGALFHQFITFFTMFTL